MVNNLKGNAHQETEAETSVASFELPNLESFCRIYSFVQTDLGTLNMTNLS